MEITRAQLIDRLEGEDHNRLHTLSIGHIAVFQYEDRIFLVNRVTRDAVEVLPDFSSGGFMLAVI